MNANYKSQNIHYVNSVKFYYLFRFSGNRVSILVENPEIFLLEVGINKLQAFFSVSKHRLYFKVCKKECNFRHIKTLLEKKQVRPFGFCAK